MNCTLAGIALPDDTVWTDELTGAWSPIAEAVERDISGRLIVEPWVVVGGRPVTLVPKWLDRSTLTALFGLLTPGRVMTLVLPDARQLTVAWRYDVPPIQATEVIPAVPPVDSDPFDTTLYLREV